MAIDETFLIDTLSELVSINSINPSIAAGGPGEARIAARIAEICSGIGLDVEVLEGTPGRPSVVATLRGTGGGRSLMLNGHIDTVGVDGMDDPFNPIIKDGRLYGRGGYDMKAGVAASIAAAKSIKNAGGSLKGDLVIAAVADEEEGSLGTKEVIAHRRTDAAIVTEPSWMKLSLAHRGFVWVRIVVEGKQAHGSRHDLGVDANLNMARVLARVHDIELELRESEPHPLAGRASLHVGLLHGGVGPTQFSPRCEANLEWRAAPGQTPEYVLGRIQAIIDELARSDPSFKAELSIPLTEAPFESQDNSPIGAIVAQSIGDLGIGDAGPSAVWFWTDAALLQAAGIDSVVMGHDGAGEHETVEWVDLESVVGLARLLEESARRYCES